jgi:hypothetical protein
MTTNGNPGAAKASALYYDLTNILTGMKTVWPATQTTLVVEQQSYTPAQFEAQAASILAPFQAVVDARNALQTALKNRADAQPGAERFVIGFYSVLPQYIGSNNADQAKFGKAPAKARAPRTVEQKAEAAAKAKATRAARHTMGKNQKNASDFRNMLAGLNLGRIELHAVA